MDKLDFPGMVLTHTGQESGHQGSVYRPSDAGGLAVRTLYAYGMGRSFGIRLKKDIATCSIAA